MKKILLAVTILSVIGCSVVTVLSEKPEVEVVGVSLKNMSFSGGTIEVECNIKNPNKNSIKLDSIGYKMSINENPIATGSMNDGVKLDGLEEKTVSIPIEFSYKDVANGISSILKKQKLNYDLSGSAKVGMFTIPFSKKGELESKKR
ncbi:MAG: LEA type 2 family protein [Bdellovibrionales bacterium]|nr:LEA type 2 family protein [Bdellovibrionales bacterium]